jgi:hypothetical protein
MDIIRAMNKKTFLRCALRIRVVGKAVVKSPLNKWRGKLKHLKGRRSDDLVGESRGHDHGG